jgi:hypothetical protein
MTSHSQRIGYGEWADYLECDTCHKKYDIMIGSEIKFNLSVEKIDNKLPFIYNNKDVTEHDRL